MHFLSGTSGGRQPQRSLALMVILLCVLILPSGVTSAFAAGPQRVIPAVRPDADLTALVNPFIGTENQGWDMPAVGAPFGLVQEAPLVHNKAGAGSNPMRLESCKQDLRI